MNITFKKQLHSETEDRKIVRLGSYPDRKPPKDWLRAIPVGATFLVKEDQEQLEYYEYLIFNKTKKAILLKNISKDIYLWVNSEVFSLRNILIEILKYE